MNPKAEREFLVQLAATWLGARLMVMGGMVEGFEKFPCIDFHSMSFHVLGCCDYAYEMKLVIKENRIVRGKTKNARSTF